MVGKSRTQASQQRQLARIDDGDGSGIGANPHVEADGRSEPRHLVDAHGGNDSSFDPPDMCPGHPGRRAHDVDRVTQDLASDAKLVTYAKPIGRREAAAAVDRAFAGAHRPSVASRAHPAVATG